MRRLCRGYRAKNCKYTVGCVSDSDETEQENLYQVQKLNSSVRNSLDVIRQFTLVSMPPTLHIVFGRLGSAPCNASSVLDGTCVLRLQLGNLNVSGDAGTDSDEQMEPYDGNGAMKFIIAVLLVYSLMGTVGMLILRIRRSATRGNKKVAMKEANRYLKDREKISADHNKSTRVTETNRVLTEIQTMGRQRSCTESQSPSTYDDARGEDPISPLLIPQLPLDLRPSTSPGRQGRFPWFFDTAWYPPGDESGSPQPHPLTAIPGQASPTPWRLDQQCPWLVAAQSPVVPLSPASQSSSASPRSDPPLVDYNAFSLLPLPAGCCSGDRSLKTVEVSAGKGLGDTDEVARHKDEQVKDIALGHQQWERQNGKKETENASTATGSVKRKRLYDKIVKPENYKDRGDSLPNPLIPNISYRNTKSKLKPADCGLETIEELSSSLENNNISHCVAKQVASSL